MLNKGENTQMTIQHLQQGASIAMVIAAIEKDGAVVLENALSSPELKLLDQDSDKHLTKTKNCQGVFFGYQTKRVASMVAKSSICEKMAEHKTVLGIMDHFLLPNCDKYQLNLSQLIAIGAGERQQIIHADDPMFPFDHDNMEVMINVMWAVDDFTKENGATYIAPGSHKWDRDRHATEEELIQAEMPAGSCLIYLGSVRHGGGANQTLSSRRGLVMSYNLGWLKQSENFFLSIPQEQARNYSTRLQELIGYFVHKPNLHMIDGRDPMEYLHDNPEKLDEKGFKDYMPEHVEDLLNQHYNGADISVAKV